MPWAWRSTADGNVYFGLGTTDFTNAYLLDEEGKAALSTSKDERGTIQKRRRPTSRAREIVATGIRFPVGLAFNRAGDLFATDQEGRDLAAQRQPVRRAAPHPAGPPLRLPAAAPEAPAGVIDEPSVFDYAPAAPVDLRPRLQRAGQRRPDLRARRRGRATRSSPATRAASSSARSSSRRPPATSRRTTSSPCLNMLPVDACVSPDGRPRRGRPQRPARLGQRPEGQGQALQDRLRRSRARRSRCWPGPPAPREVRVAFDRPLDPEPRGPRAEGDSIEYGQVVAAGDRFESLRPGYAVVAGQMVDARFDAADPLVAVSADRRTLILATDPARRGRRRYALTLPGSASRGLGRRGFARSPRSTSATTSGRRGDLDARRRAAAPGPAGCRISTSPSRALHRGSAEHDRLWHG